MEKYRLDPVLFFSTAFITDGDDDETREKDMASEGTVSVTVLPVACKLHTDNCSSFNLILKAN